MTGATTSPPKPVFREHASGLLVPEAISRAREVWTRAEMRAIDKATALLQSRRVAFQFRCANPACDEPTMVRSHDHAGQAVLECGCTRRVFTNL